MLIVLLSGGCMVGPTATVAPSQVREDRPTTGPTAIASPSAVATDPGRPFDGATVLEAMRTSRRPGGVPDEIETLVIATAIADRVWTIDGQPWPMMSIGGSCGPENCTVEVGGTPPQALGEDLYVFSIARADGAVFLESADLRGLPAGLTDVLDSAVRAALPAERLSGLSLVSARWLPPPDAGRFVLAYRSGGEEGSPGLDVTFDLHERLVVEATPVG